MKILFINPSLRPNAKRRRLPVGLAYIMTAVKKAGFDFALVDMDINSYTTRDLEYILAKETYDVYALGCIVTGFKIAKGIVDIIKKINPESIVIVGNSVATSIPEILLNNTKADIAVVGEGDITIVELLKTLELKKPLSKVNGIAFKNSGNIIYTDKQPVIDNIDTIGFPDWDLFDLEEYSKYGQINTNHFSPEAILSFPLNSARGCPLNCTFCYHAFKGEKYRRYSEESVIEEIKRLYFFLG